MDEKQPPIIETNRIRIAASRARIAMLTFFGDTLNALGFPGFVQPMEVDDWLTGSRLKIEVTPLFTVISFDGREFYFYRRNGKYDGSGMSTGGLSKERRQRLKQQLKSRGFDVDIADDDTQPQDTPR